MYLFESVYCLSKLDDTIEMCNKLLGPLQEKIVINGRFAKVEIESNNLKDIFKDVRQTSLAAKNLYSQFETNQTHKNTFNKFFRLISENTSKLKEFTEKLFNNPKIINKLPEKIVTMGKRIMSTFVDGINSVLTFVGNKLKDNSIKLVNKPSWEKEEVKDWMEQYKKYQSLGYNMLPAGI